MSLSLLIAFLGTAALVLVPLCLPMREHAHHDE